MSIHPETESLFARPPASVSTSSWEPRFHLQDPGNHLPADKGVLAYFSEISTYTGIAIPALPVPPAPWTRTERKAALGELEMRGHSH